MSEIKKTLTPNDVGATGSHQAGMAIPKDPDILAFFPELDATELNPRVSLRICVPSLAEEHTANFIYYNGRTLGFNTRNEYRLTGLTAIFRALGAQAGDVVHLAHRPEDGDYTLSIRRPPEGRGPDRQAHPGAEVAGSKAKPGQSGTITIKGWTVYRQENPKK